MLDKFYDIFENIPDWLQAIIVMSVVSIFWIYVLG